MTGQAREEEEEDGWRLSAQICNAGDIYTTSFNLCGSCISTNSPVKCITTCYNMEAEQISPRRLCKTL